MSKKEEFKEFAKSHPELVKSVHTGKSTWQELYEIYDIYGQDDRAWKNYLKDDSATNINNIADIMKKIDMDSVQKHINTAQKALGLVGELTGMKASTPPNQPPSPPRPINKFFED